MAGNNRDVENAHHTNGWPLRVSRSVARRARTPLGSGGCELRRWLFGGSISVDHGFGTATQPGKNLESVCGFGGGVMSDTTTMATSEQVKIVTTGIVS